MKVTEEGTMDHRVAVKDPSTTQMPEANFQLYVWVHHGHIKLSSKGEELMALQVSLKSFVLHRSLAMLFGYGDFRNITRARVYSALL